jgi:hypothetical protein
MRTIYVHSRRSRQNETLPAGIGKFVMELFEAAWET